LGLDPAVRSVSKPLTSDAVSSHGNGFLIVGQSTYDEGLTPSTFLRPDALALAAVHRLTLDKSLGTMSPMTLALSRLIDSAPSV
jgi:hypothetical protein